MKIHALILFFAFLVSNVVFAAPDEIHWTFRGPTSVTFDWRGSAAENTLRYGTVSGSYGPSLSAATPSPVPTSSAGPFWELTLADLQADTLYYYSIAGGPEHTFRTPQPPENADFTVYAVGDIGSAQRYANAGSVQNIMGNVYGNGFPHFVLAVGDLSYGDVDGTLRVDQHFNDVMLWSQDAAYMPAWGNHEWNTSSTLPDDFYNYLGRFAFPNAQTSPGTEAVYHYAVGKDWYWFDYGPARFIAYPQAYSTATLPDWNSQVQAVMSAAQSDPAITFIVTFGHSPAYSSSGAVNASLKTYLDGLAQLYSKYTLDLCGHHHHYERTDPVQTGGVTHLVVGTGHSNISTFTTTQPSWSLFRTKQPGALKLHFVNNAGGAFIEGQFICAPASSVCNAAGTVLDAFGIGGAPINHAPVLAAIGNQTVTAGNTLNFSASATDADGDSLTYSLAGEPPGASINASTGAFGWTPSATGSYSFTVKVCDNAIGPLCDEEIITVSVTSASGGIASLTHQWDFDENAGTSALDSVGTNNAILTNTLWVAGKTGSAVSFNGTNSSGNPGKIDFGTGNFTVAHWVKVSGFKNSAGIFNNRSSSGANLGFQTRTDGTSTLKALIDFGAKALNIAVNNAITGAWYHVAVSVDRSGFMKLYINGALAKQADISAYNGIGITNGGSVRIGRAHNAVYFNGVIDNLRLYNSALSDAEILNVYNE